MHKNLQRACPNMQYLTVFRAPLTLIAALLLSAMTLAEPLHFGPPIKPELSVAVDQVIAHPDRYLGQEITIEGIVDSVCSKRGCWMQILTSDVSGTLRVKVKDGVMVFPISARGRTALVTGTLTALELSLEQNRGYQAHMAADAGEQFDPDSVQTPATLYQLNPAGVTILDR
jgi:hypothetical protein